MPDVLVQSWRYKPVAKRPLRKLLKGQCQARCVIGTDNFSTHGVAKRKLMLGAEHHRRKGINNFAENSYQPTRRRER